jgi:hypothetical protein
MIGLVLHRDSRTGADYIAVPRPSTTSRRYQFKSNSATENHVYRKLTDGLATIRQNPFPWTLGRLWGPILETKFNSGSMSALGW